MQNDIMVWLESHIPETILLVGGILAILVALTYARNKDGGKYKILLVIGALFGVLMAFETLTIGESWRAGTSIIILITAFALIVRPFRNVNLAVVFALLVMAAVYVSLGDLNGVMLFDHIDLSVLASGWPRIILALVVGAMVYGILGFIQAIVQLFGKILNCWPILTVLGIICIVEAYSMYMGYISVFDYIMSLAGM